MASVRSGPNCRAEDIGEVDLKGIAEPVRVYRLLSFDDEAVGGLSRPFVGRQPELQAVYRGAPRLCGNRQRAGGLSARRGRESARPRLTEEFERVATAMNVQAHRALILDFGVG